MPIFILICDYIFICGAYSSLTAAREAIAPNRESKLDLGVWEYQRPDKNASGFYQIFTKVLDK